MDRSCPDSVGHHSSSGIADNLNRDNHSVTVEGAAVETSSRYPFAHAYGFQVAIKLLRVGRGGELVHFPLEGRF
jgi:hypothetical protein